MKERWRRERLLNSDEKQNENLLFGSLCLHLSDDCVGNCLFGVFVFSGVFEEFHQH